MINTYQKEETGYLVFFFTSVYQGLSKHQEVSSTPVMKVKKLIVVFWDLLGAIKKINPETYVLYGSYELLLSNVAHQMKEKLTIQNKFFPFLKSNFTEIWNLFLFQWLKTTRKKQVLRVIVNCISYLGCLAN